MLFHDNILAIAAAGTTGSETTSPRDAEALPFLFSGETAKLLSYLWFFFPTKFQSKLLSCFFSH